MLPLLLVTALVVAPACTPKKEAAEPKAAKKGADEGATGADASKNVIEGKPIDPEDAKKLGLPEDSTVIPVDAPKHVPIVGETTPEAVISMYPQWGEKRDLIVADVEASRALADVPKGASVTVVFGTWCADCYRELPRFWKALDIAGDAIPFTVTYIGIDEDFQAPNFDPDALKIQRIPTFIVSRDGEEVGRVIETTTEVRGIESEVLDLLAGRTSGVITATTELITSSPDGDGNEAKP